MACRKSRGPLIGAKPGRFYVRVTAEGVKMDVKFMCALLGEKVRVAAQEEPREDSDESNERNPHWVHRLVPMPKRGVPGRRADVLRWKIICSAGVFKRTPGASRPYTAVWKIYWACLPRRI